MKSNLPLQMEKTQKIEAQKRHKTYGLPVKYEGIELL